MATPSRTPPAKAAHWPAIALFAGAGVAAAGLLVHILSGGEERAPLIDVEAGERIQGREARMRAGLQLSARRPAPQPAPVAAEPGRAARALEALRAEKREAEALFQRRLEAERARHARELAAVQADRAEQDRLAAEMASRRRAAAAARITSDAVVVDDGSAAPAAGAPRPARSANARFVADSFEPDAPYSVAQRLAEQDRLVAQGALIQATLETALSSELPGMIRAVVSEDVYSFGGASVAIPKGSRLIGEYVAETELGQARVMAAWRRLIRPDGVSIALGAPATDDLGRAGLAGDVDSRFAERFGSAALVSVLSALGGAAEARANQAVHSGENQDISLDFQDDFDEATQSAFERYLSLKPVIHVDQGAKIAVFVTRDLVF